MSARVGCCYCGQKHAGYERGKAEGIAEGIRIERARVVAYFTRLAAPRSGMGSGLVTRQQRDAWGDAAMVIEAGEHLAKEDASDRSEDK